MCVRFIEATRSGNQRLRVTTECKWLRAVGAFASARLLQAQRDYWHKKVNTELFAKTTIVLETSKLALPSSLKWPAQHTGRAEADFLQHPLHSRKTVLSRCLPPTTERLNCTQHINVHSKQQQAAGAAANPLATPHCQVFHLFMALATLVHLPFCEPLTTRQSASPSSCICVCAHVCVCLASQPASANNENVRISWESLLEQQRRLHTRASE